MTLDYLMMGVDVSFHNAVYLASESPVGLPRTIERLCAIKPNREVNQPLPFSLGIDLSGYCLTQTPSLNSTALWSLMKGMGVPDCVTRCLSATDYLCNMSTYRPSSGINPASNNNDPAYHLPDVNIGSRGLFIKNIDVMTPFPPGLASVESTGFFKIDDTRKLRVGPDMDPLEFHRPVHLFSAARSATFPVSRMPPKLQNDVGGLSKFPFRGCPEGLAQPMWSTVLMAIMSHVLDESEDLLLSGGLLCFGDNITVVGLVETDDAHAKLTLLLKRLTDRLANGAFIVKASESLLSLGYCVPIRQHYTIKVRDDNSRSVKVELCGRGAKNLLSLGVRDAKRLNLAEYSASVIGTILGEIPNPMIDQAFLVQTGLVICEHMKLWLHLDLLTMEVHDFVAKHPLLMMCVLFPAPFFATMLINNVIRPSHYADVTVKSVTALNEANRSMRNTGRITTMLGNNTLTRWLQAQISAKIVASEIMSDRPVWKTISKTAKALNSAPNLKTRLTYMTWSKTSMLTPLILLVPIRPDVAPSFTNKTAENDESQHNYDIALVDDYGQQLNRAFTYTVGVVKTDARPRKHPLPMQSNSLVEWLNQYHKSLYSSVINNSFESFRSLRDSVPVRTLVHVLLLSGCDHMTLNTSYSSMRNGRTQPVLSGVRRLTTEGTSGCVLCWELFEHAANSIARICETVGLRTVTVVGMATERDTHSHLVYEPMTGSGASRDLQWMLSDIQDEFRLYAGDWIKVYVLFCNSAMHHVLIEPAYGNCFFNFGVGVVTSHELNNRVSPCAVGTAVLYLNDMTLKGVVDFINCFSQSDDPLSVDVAHDHLNRIMLEAQIVLLPLIDYSSKPTDIPINDVLLSATTRSVMFRDPKKSKRNRTKN